MSWLLANCPANSALQNGWGLMNFDASKNCSGCLYTWWNQLMGAWNLLMGVWNQLPYNNFLLDQLPPFTRFSIILQGTAIIDQNLMIDYSWLKTWVQVYDCTLLLMYVVSWTYKTSPHVFAYEAGNEKQRYGNLIAVKWPIKSSWHVYAQYQNYWDFCSHF